MKLQKYLASILIASALFHNGVILSQSLSEARKQITENKYNEAIKTLTSSANLDHLGDRGKIVLGQACLLQAELYRDMYELQNSIGKDYFWNRDTSRFTRITDCDSYFFGRYLQATGRYEKAAACFKKAENNGAKEIRKRASMWLRVAEIQRDLNDASHADSYGNSLIEAEYAYALRSEGESADVPVLYDMSSVNGKRMSLWSASLSGDPDKIFSIVENFGETIEPDITKKYGKDYILKFYDPATLKVFSDAYFSAAAAVFVQIEADEFRDRKCFFSGSSSYKAGRFDYAEEQLSKLKNTSVTSQIYTAAILYRKGDRNQAYSIWNKLFEKMKYDDLVVYGDILHGLSGEREELQRVCTLLKQGADSMDRALSAARCLMRMERSSEALGLLQSHYPVLKHNKIEYITPSYLTVMARAKYLEGRKYYSDVLGHISAVSSAGYHSLHILDMARSFMAPENPSAGREKRISY